MYPAPSTQSRLERRVRLAALVTVVLAGSAGSAVAQGVAASGKDVLDGFWWSVSAGASGARLTCDVCDPGRDLGPSMNLAVGAYAGPGLRVGVEAGGWANNEEDEVRETGYRAGVVVQLHPKVESGFQLLGGLGWSGHRAEEYRYDAARLTVGLAWDLPLAAGFVIGNSVMMDAASFGSLRHEDVKVARGVGMSVVRIGVYLRQR